MKSLRGTFFYKVVIDGIYRSIINPLDRRKKRLASQRVLEIREASDVFDRIYRENLWTSPESRSGTGSTLEATSELRRHFRKLLLDFNIKTLLDLPCGDFNWMQHIDLTGFNYIGADIVDVIVERNRVYETENIRFMKLDLAHDTLPKVDLILVRDCFVHLSDQLIFRAIENVKRSQIKYILTTTFIDHETNSDIPTGLWRQLNLQKPPFQFSEPLAILPDHGPKANSKKCLGLWQLQH